MFICRQKLWKSVWHVDVFNKKYLKQPHTCLHLKDTKEAIFEAIVWTTVFNTVHQNAARYNEIFTSLFGVLLLYWYLTYSVFLYEVQL